MGESKQILSEHRKDKFHVIYAKGFLSKYGLYKYWWS